jgi:predicted HTH transcriptional regulator
MSPRVSSRAHHTLETIQRLEPVSAPALARELGCSLPTTRNTLALLRKQGLVQADGCNRWARWSVVRDRNAAPLVELCQASSVWEYAARCQQEVRA